MRVLRKILGLAVGAAALFLFPATIAFASSGSVTQPGSTVQTTEYQWVQPPAVPTQQWVPPVTHQVARTVTVNPPPVQTQVWHPPVSTWVPPTYKTVSTYHPAVYKTESVPYSVAHTKYCSKSVRVCTSHTTWISTYKTGGGHTYEVGGYWKTTQSCYYTSESYACGTYYTTSYTTKQVLVSAAYTSYSQVQTGGGYYTTTPGYYTTSWYYPPSYQTTVYTTVVDQPGYWQTVMVSPPGYFVQTSYTQNVGSGGVDSGTTSGGTGLHTTETTTANGSGNSGNHNGHK